MKKLAFILVFLFSTSPSTAQWIDFGDGFRYSLTTGATVGFAWNTATGVPVVGALITQDTIHGTLHGTLMAGKTYYMDSDVIIPEGDTVLLQPGVTVIVLGSTQQIGTPEFQVFGSLISFGTKTQPNYLTVPASLHLYQNLVTGLWGGIACSPTSGDLILKWTHVEYAGGAAAQNDPINKPGGGRYGIWFENPASNLIIEDSHISGGDNDPIRVNGGKISIFRNVFESNASTSGDGPNIKSGTAGDMAYNLFVGTCTNGPKLSNKGGASPQTNVNIYNNTIITCGWRFIGTGRAGSTDIEEGARGSEYNNIIVNCFTGFRLVSNPIADTAHVYYDYQWYYANDSISETNIYPHDGISCQIRKPHDHAGAKGANDPMFVKYNVNAVATNHYVYPSAFASQDPMENVKASSPYSDITSSFNSDFHLQSGSLALGSAFTGPAPVQIPMNAVSSIKSETNPFGADAPNGLGKDFGAYQADGSGNQQ